MIIAVTTCYGLPGCKSSTESAHRLLTQSESFNLPCELVAAIILSIGPQISRLAFLQPSKGLLPFVRELLVRPQHPDETTVIQPSAEMMAK